MVNKSALNGSLTFQNNSPQVESEKKMKNLSTLSIALINESQLKFQ
ncbi:hypothetical protein T03_14480 [Trichinella britovi]|uniref:Uncharacterized protein n=1 Tax=Trichinella britovi TaxID=45882 RepID=A0A0V0Z0A6_TRIBR|nr:hypothetical protein T03_14480 [Trichinella britovi]